MAHGLTLVGGNVRIDINAEQPMTLRLRPLLLILGAVAVSVLSVVFHPKAEETSDDVPPSSVSEADVQTYIEVYSAMQDNHDLTIDDAIKPYHVSLDMFRQTERHIQDESRLVERVRDALLEHAKKRALFAQAPGDKPAEAPPTATPTHRVREKKPRDKGK